MSYSDEARAAELRAEERDRRLQIYEAEADLVAQDAHRWRAFPWLLADSIAAGVVTGIGVAMGATSWLFVIYFAPGFSPLAALILGSVPLAALALVALVLSVGPMRLGGLRHPKIVANGLLILWLIGTLVFTLVVISLAPGTGATCLGTYPGPCPSAPGP